MAENRPSTLRQKIDAEIQKITVEGINARRVDLAALQRKNTPLAKIIGEFVSSTTMRDNADDLAGKIELALTARDDNSKLAKALDDLKKQLG